MNSLRTNVNELKGSQADLYSLQGFEYSYCIGQYFCEFALQLNIHSVCDLFTRLKGHIPYRKNNLPVVICDQWEIVSTVLIFYLGGVGAVEEIENTVILRDQTTYVCYFYQSHEIIAV